MPLAWPPATEIVVEARSPAGERVVVESQGFEARCIQHELDHLDGILFIDRLDPVTRDRIKRKIKKEGLREDAARHAFAL